MPSFFEPMKATLAAGAFDDPAWVFERKLDGIRALVFRDGDEVRLFSRTGRAMTGYPELEECAGGRPVQAGSSPTRRSSRSVRAASPASSGSRGGWASPIPLRRGAPASRCSSTSSTSSGSRATTRATSRCSPARSSSQARWRFDGPVGFVSHVPEHGKTLYAKACEAGYEGLIAKRAESTYVCRRSRDWLKLKCHFEQEFVVIGFPHPRAPGRVRRAARGYWEGDECATPARSARASTRRRCAPRQAPARAGDRPAPAAPRPGSAGCSLGQTRARCSGRFLRMDARWKAAPPSFPRPAGGQGPERGRARAAGLTRLQGQGIGSS